MCVMESYIVDPSSQYIRGSIATDDWARLRDYARTVSKFILTDVTKDITNKDPEARVSPAAFLRLARLQQPDMPLLPSLTDIVILDADASMAYLELLLTPSLKSLEVSRIPDAQQSTFFSFLTAIEQEAPLLQTLIFGTGLFPSSSLQIISKFNNLRHLELKHEDSEIPFAFFDNIGSLPKLDTLILDARYVSSSNLSKNQSNSTDEPPAFEAVNPLPSDSSSGSNLMDSNRDKDIADDVLHSPTYHTPISTSGTFNQLAKLHVVGWLPLLQDLISRMMSTSLEDVSVTLIRLTDGELQVSLAKEEAEKKRKAEEKRWREEAEKKRREEERKWREEAEKKKKEEEKWWEEEAEKRRKEEKWRRDEPEKSGAKETEQPLGAQWGGSFFSSGYDITASPIHQSDSSFGLTNSKKKKGTKSHYDKPESAEESAEERRCREQEKKMQEEREVQKKLLKEQERLAHVAFGVYTVPFTELLRTLCSRWAASLKAVSVCQLGGSFQRLLNPPTFPEETLRELLLLPAIENLEIKGWMLDSVESILNKAEPIPNLKSLLLPLDETNSGISLPTLRHIAKTYPKLESFQCRIEPLSQIPEYPVPTTDALSHGLRTLSVGNSSPLPNAKRLHLIARHLYLLFPHLETINTSEEHNAEQWVIVDELVKMCQTARMDDMNRPPSPLGSE